MLLPHAVTSSKIVILQIGPKIFTGLVAMANYVAVIGEKIPALFVTNIPIPQLKHNICSLSGYKISLLH